MIYKMFTLLEREFNVIETTFGKYYEINKLTEHYLLKCVVNDATRRTLNILF